MRGWQSTAHTSEQVRQVQDVRPAIDAIPTPAWSAQEDGSADFFNQRWLEYTGLSGAAHYVSDHRDFFGIVFPTKHRIFGLQPDGHAAPEPLVVSINMDQLVLS